MVLFFWMALHTSQSFIDLADFLLIVAAFWTALKSSDLQSLLRAFKPSYIWLIWISVVILGFIFGAPVEFKSALKSIWEFRWFVSFICYVYLFKKIPWGEIQLRSFSLVLLIFSVLDLILFFVNYKQDPRAGGLFGHSMPFAHTMGPSALFLLYVGIKKALEPKRRLLWRGVYMGAPLLAAGMVVLSFTRGVWIGFSIAILICTAFLGRRFFISSLLTLALVAGGLFAGSERIRSRVMGKTNAESQSNSERVNYWRANFKIFLDYPIFGIGYSQNNVHVEEYLHRDGVDWMPGSAHAHNQYIQFLAGTGILGLLCFLVFLGSVFYPVLRGLLWMKKQGDTSDVYFLLVGIFAAMLCFSIAALTESNFSIAKNRFVFLFISAIGYAIAGSQPSKASANEPGK